jgi:thiol:disulfide interchange protein DsbG
MKKLVLAVSASILAMSATFAFAQASGAAPAAPAEASGVAMPKALSKALLGGLKFEKSFAAAGGLNGFIVSSGPGKNMVLYAPANNSVLMTGKLLDDNGVDLSQQYLDQYGPKADFSQYQKRIESAPAIIEGAKGSAVKSTVYVIMDPNCIFCHLTWKALQPYEAAGLQVRWIPVAFQQASSTGKAAALLDAKDGEALLRKGENSYVEAKESIGIDPIAVSATAKAKLDSNTKLMADMGFRGTPTVLYKDKSGNIAVVEGMPKLHTLPDLLGLPEQAITDPELQRYR